MMKKTLKNLAHCLLPMLLSYGFLLPNAQAEESAWNNDAKTPLETLPITVYKSPSCGCCNDWITHLEQHQFQVKTIDLANLSAIKMELGVPQKLQSCHTAVVNGYVIEGHVPATDIRQLVEQQSSHLGLAVPHMPVGSPGMEMGARKDDFKIIAFDKNGIAETVKEYRDY